MRSGGLEWRRLWSLGVFTARTLALCERVSGVGLGEQGRRPRRLGPRGMSAAGRDAKRSRSDMARAKARRTRLELEAQCRELRLCRVARLGNGVAHGEHQPEVGGVEDEANLLAQADRREPNTISKIQQAE
jgi:hypothetical protein